MHTYKLDLIEYDTWGNEDDGWEVNDLYKVLSEIVVISQRELSCAELAKKLHNINSYDIFGKAIPVKLDLRRLNIVDSWPYIELELKNGKPVGRIEVTDIPE